MALGLMAIEEIQYWLSEFESLGLKVRRMGLIIYKKLSI